MEPSEKMSLVSEFVTDDKISSGQLYIALACLSTGNILVKDRNVRSAVRILGRLLPFERKTMRQLLNTCESLQPFLLHLLH